MDIWVAVITGVCASFVASVVFLLCLLLVRPNVSISPKIARYTDNHGNLVYGIKIINRTRWPIHNVRSELHIIARGLSSGGPVDQTREISLKRPFILHIDRFNLNDKDAKYAFRIVTFEDVEAIWKDDPNWYLRLTVYAEHEVSGFGRVFFRNYHRKDHDILTGQFQFGNTFEIDRDKPILRDAHPITEKESVTRPA